MDGQRVVGRHTAHAHFQRRVDRTFDIQRSLSASAGTDRAQIKPIGHKFQRLGTPENTIDYFFYLRSYSGEVAAMGITENPSARRSFVFIAWKGSLVVDGIDEPLQVQIGHGAERDVKNKRHILVRYLLYRIGDSDRILDPPDIFLARSEQNDRGD